MLFLWVARREERWVSSNKWEWGRTAKKQNEIPLNCLGNPLTHINTCIYIYIHSDTHTTQVKLWKAKFTVRVFQWHFLPPVFLPNRVRPAELHKSSHVCVFCWGHSEDRGILGVYFYIMVKLTWAQNIPSPISLSSIQSKASSTFFSLFLMNFYFQCGALQDVWEARNKKSWNVLFSTFLLHPNTSITLWF